MYKNIAIIVLSIGLGLMLFYYVVKDKAVRNLSNERDSLRVVSKELNVKIDRQLLIIDSLNRNQVIIEKKYEIIKYNLIKSNDVSEYLNYITKSINNK